MKNVCKRSNRIGLPAMVALGGSLASLPAFAIELSEVSVQSRLGQPLRASIAYALAPNEEISRSCVSLGTGATPSGLPGIGAATLSVANGVIQLTGSVPVREPMMATQISIRCPYSANITREYMLFVDPALPAYDIVSSTNQTQAATAAPVATAAAPVASRPQSRATSNNQARSTSRDRVSTPKDITTGSRFRVPGGTTASEIAARIVDRPVGLWPAVFAIVDANPDAFVDGDPNQLKAGSWLTIPSFSATAAAAQAPVSPVAEEVSEPSASVTDAPAVSKALDIVPSPDAQLDSTTNDLLPPVEALEQVIDQAALDDVENPYLNNNAVETVVITDTALEGPTTNSSTPNVATATPVSTTTVDTATATQAATTTPSWLLWLAGSGVAIILGLVLFGRRFRQDRDNAPLTPMAPIAETPQRRASDTASMESLGVDYDLSDDSPTDQNPILDADLVIGSGLGKKEDVSIDVSGDFGFATPDTINAELPFEPLPNDDMTDMLPVMDTGESSILDSEILPQDDDYDMSVIVDATKMPIPEEVTERDLKAVVVESGDDTLVSDSYTISEEADFQILEQDYEDELTATQALNFEIERAAAELAERVDSEDDADTAIEETLPETTALPMATVIELDVTSQMPSGKHGNDETGITESLESPPALDDATVEMPNQDDDDDADRTTALKFESRKKG